MNVTYDRTTDTLTVVVPNIAVQFEPKYVVAVLTALLGILDQQGRPRDEPHDVPDDQRHQQDDQ